MKRIQSLGREVATWTWEELVDDSEYDQNTLYKTLKKALKFFLKDENRPVYIKTFQRLASIDYYTKRSHL